MKQVTLNVEDSKFQAFISFIQTLDYVSVSSDETIPEWQQEEVGKRLKSYKNNPDQALDFNTAMEDIEKDL